MNAHAALKPVDLGTKVNDVQVAAHAVDHAATIYLSTPNYPDCQELKARRWQHYQQMITELMVAVHG